MCDSDEASNMENSSSGLLLSSPISDHIPILFFFFTTSVELEKCPRRFID